jgi:hypothetical protein
MILWNFGVGEKGNYNWFFLKILFDFENVKQTLTVLNDEGKLI